MKAFSRWTVFFVPAIVIMMGTIVTANPSSGTISGTIKDNDDRPLVGAVIRIFNNEQETILKTTTDKNGRFLASNLSPGNYKLKAIATGYKPIEVAKANVNPSQNTIFDLKLEKASSLISEEQQKDSYKYVLRRNRTIFQWDEQEYIAEKKPFIRESHGFVNLTSSKTFSRRPFPGSSTSLNFALSQMINEDIELVVAGQTGLAVNSPQRLDVQTTLSQNENHTVELAIGYGQLPTLTPNAEKPITRDINQYTIRAIDKWRISGPVVLVYGFDYSHFDGAKQSNHFTPRVNLDLQVSPNDQLFAAIYSPDGADIEASTEFETTKVDFKGPVELISLVPEPTLETNQRYEFGYSHTFKDRSRLETALFWDKVSSRTIPILSGENVDSQPDNNLTLNTISQTGDAKGVRVVFSHPLSSNISTMVGYSFGQGQEINFSQAGQPIVSVGYFHIFTGKVNAQLFSTGTKVSAVMRLASPNALLAIDPFQKQMRMIDPNISIYLTQTVPMFDFVPGKWEATVDARNLLDLKLGDKQTRVAINQYWRTIRGGFSVRF
ncbi:MAG: TonB-dependent receptor [Acidobacteria bacterium]|nr:TonB-dependent receptor [Acidobacteriota bacterium]